MGSPQKNSIFFAVHQGFKFPLPSLNMCFRVEGKHIFCVPFFYKHLIKYIFIMKNIRKMCSYIIWI